MYVSSIIFGTIGILYSYVIAELNEQSNVTNSEVSRIEQELLFTSLLKTEKTNPDAIEHYTFPINNTYRSPLNRRCPLCDSSVYPYCGEKLLHDACCCTDSYIHDLPHQCKLADCRFLHANSCKEHRLIALCCCNDDYRTLLKNLSKRLKL
ncbi:uncharacterized protein LOC114880411 isoform X1 [Osmia bicornis bicornis]|uniref:uncharacterized protein LOC114880411 isoform X1 n=1 Tax=Osmia bicornis bicornis TaxID=1437191 RepID=UPI0010F92B08|nr:uncharacterized protein LOC114880411 isoform X1 [Osmia bicornis bicornis]